MADENQTSIMERDIKGMVESVLLSDPTLKDRLTMSAVASYMRLPDNSFGWAQGEMPWPAKVLAVTTCLKLGLLPGTGAIYFLGSSLYISTAAARTRANSDPNWIYKSIKYMPLDEFEKQAYLIEDGDIAIKLCATVIKGGHEVELEGIGICGKEEIKNNKVWGYAAHNGFSKKNLIQTLRTRAEKDLLKRYYPIGGVTIADSTDPEVIDVTPEREKLPTTPEGRKERFESVMQFHKENDKDLVNAKTNLDETLRTAFAHFAESEIVEMLGVSIDEMQTCTDIDRVITATCILRDAIDDRETNPNNTKTNLAGETTETQKRGRGRPKKEVEEGNSPVVEQAQPLPMQNRPVAKNEGLNIPPPESEFDGDSQQLQSSDVKVNEYGQDIAALNTIKRLLNHPKYTNPALKIQLTKLTAKKLLPGDSVEIAQGARMAERGSFGHLLQLVSNRESV